MTREFKDHFSGHAADYALFRPDYPAALFDWLASVTEHHRLAWDCATGNGQAAHGLARLFDAVIATDASAEQLRAGARHDGIRYVCATAERAPLRDGCVDLVTVAQALHWLDLDRFYAEARRVVVPGGVIAVWSYALMAVEPEIDALVDSFYGETLAGFWPPERRHVDARYESLPFPFAEIDVPRLEMTRSWTLGELMGYVGTWSAVHRFRAANGEKELTRFASRLAELWGSRERARRVRWPLAIRAGRISGE